jgi:uncharacterized membrane protein YcaP (DUF421 family)
MELTIEIILQTILAFFAVFFFARLIGKKQVSELTFYDYINGITFGSIAANLVTDTDQHTGRYLIGIALFAALTALFQFLSLKSRTIRKVIEGEPVVLIHQGEILEENMATTRFNMGDLMSQLRQQNIFNIKEVNYAILEQDGTVSVLRKAEKQTVQREDLSLEVEQETVWRELIIDGQIIKANLTQNNLSQEWLEKKLRQQNIHNRDQVMLALYNPKTDELHLDTKNDNLEEDKLNISDHE